MESKVIFGSGGQAWRFIQSLAPRRERLLYFLGGKDFSRGWRGARLLLSQLTARLPPGLVEEQMRVAAPAVSLIFPSVVESLTEGEARYRGLLKAQVTSHMTHNWVLQYGLFREVARFFCTIFNGRGFTLVVPGIENLESEDAALLRAMYRWFPAESPNLIVVVNSSSGPVFDSGGLVWGLTAGKQRQLLFDLQAMPCSETVVLGADHGPPDELADDAWSLAAQTSEPVEEWSPADLIAAARGAFESFAFGSAVKLGLLLLSRDPAFDSMDRAEVTSMVSLAAHNRQFRTLGNALLSEFLERHLLEALSLERRPIRRCAILYRLAVVYGRRMGRFEGALSWVEQGLSIVGDLAGTADAVYQEAWLRNIRSYIYVRGKRLGEAAEELEVAWSSLSGIMLRNGATGNRDKVQPLDIKSSCSLLAHNSANLLKMTGVDPGQRSVWLERAGWAIKGVWGAERFDSYAWIELHSEQLRLDLALARAYEGLESSRVHLDAQREYHYALVAADLCSRLGLSSQCLSLLGHAIEMRVRCGRPPLPSLAVLCAIEELNADRPSKAMERFEDLLRQPLPSTMAAEINGWLAIASARINENLDIRPWLSRGKALAAESGDPGTRFRVACMAGDALQAQGNIEGARESYSEARAAFSTYGELLRATKPADRFIQVLGLQECREGHGDFLAELLDLLPQALERPKSWWALKRLLVQIEGVGEEHRAFLKASQGDTLSLLLSVSSQRLDCKSILELLK